MIIGVSNGEMFTSGRVKKEFPVLRPFGTSGQGALEGNGLFSGGYVFYMDIIICRQKWFNV